MKRTKLPPKAISQSYSSLSVSLSFPPRLILPSFQVAFADLEHKVAVAITVNRLTLPHRNVARKLVTLILRDLGVGKPLKGLMV